MDVANKIENANKEAIRRIIDSRPVWTDVLPAIDAIPGMEKNLILHSGPPISWEIMSQPQKNAVIGAILYEGLANTPQEADRLCIDRGILLEPCHNYTTVGAMCGVTSASMNVLVVENEHFGNKAYCHLYENPAKESLRYGVYDENVLRNIRWIDTVVAKGLKAGLRTAGGRFDIRPILTRAINMGDEFHTRNLASTSVFNMEFMPYIIKSSIEDNIKFELANFIKRSNHFFLHFVMAYCKASLDAAKNIRYSSILTTIARNGVDIGIKISSLGEKWFTGPAQPIEGLYFNPYSIDDALPDIGDSSAIETYGFGGMILVNSPAVSLLIDSGFDEAMKLMGDSESICYGSNPHFGMPVLNGKNIPVGIDIRKVVETGVVPRITTSAVHKEKGGLIGEGVAKVPFSLFKEAFYEYVKQVESY